MPRRGVINESRFGFKGGNGYQCICLRRLLTALAYGASVSGPPYQILNAWQLGAFELVVSQEILDEYYRVGEILAEEHPKIDLNPTPAPAHQPRAHRPLPKCVSQRHISLRGESQVG